MFWNNGHTKYQASGISTLRNIPVLSLRGQGVLIGIVDTGIDYTMRPLSSRWNVKDFVYLGPNYQDGPSPEGFNIGTVYSNEQINAALQSDDPFSLVPTRDEDGHGTFLAGIAAGNRNEEASLQESLLIQKL